MACVRLLFLTLFAFLFLILGQTSAGAGASYFRESEPLPSRAHEGLAIMLFFSDGILGFNPVRAVVVDAAGDVYAVSMMSKAMVKHCRTSNAGKSCVAYDRSEGIISELDFEALENGGEFAKAGYPLFDPFDLETEWGFTKRQATPLEVAKFEALVFFGQPLMSLIDVTWWFVIWCFVARLFWKWQRRRSALWPPKFVPTVEAIASLAVISVMLLYTFFALILNAAPLYLTYVACALGCLLGFWITKPKAVAGDQKIEA